MWQKLSSAAVVIGSLRLFALSSAYVLWWLDAYFQTEWTQIRLLTTSDDLNCIWRTSSEIYFKMIITSINKENSQKK